MSSRNAESSFSLTYANEWQDYVVSEDTLNDPTQRDDLIALGLDPETGRGRGRVSALILDGGRNTTGNLLDARKGYVATLTSSRQGSGSAATSRTASSPPRGATTTPSATGRCWPFAHASARSMA